MYAYSMFHSICKRALVFSGSENEMIKRNYYHDETEILSDILSDIECSSLPFKVCKDVRVCKEVMGEGFWRRMVDLC